MNQERKPGWVVFTPPGTTEPVAVDLGYFGGDYADTYLRATERGAWQRFDTKLCDESHRLHNRMMELRTEQDELARLRRLAWNNIDRLADGPTS